LPSLKNPTAVSAWVHRFVTAFFVRAACQPQIYQR
jgi:hypothetical protein